MKSILKAFAIIAIILCAVSAVAQQQSDDTVTIPKSSLTDQQKADLAAKQLTDKQAMFGKWVGIGDEVGKAINSGLAAVTKQTNDFAQTPVGKWTVFVIVFKVVGEKIIQYLLGIVMILIGVPTWVWSYRKYLPKRYLTRVNYDKDTGKLVSKEYNYGYGDGSNRLDSDTASGWCVGHWVGLVLAIIIVCMVMFIGS
jgi:hypothetical protein